MKAGPLERLDALWTKVEVSLLCVTAAALVGSLAAWVVLKGLAAETTSTFIAGATLRVVVLSGLLGSLAWRLSRRALVTAGAVLLGVVVGVLLRDVGVRWAGNVLGWVQDGSSATLFGGLRGVSTRLTLLLAFLGASLATATGRHLTIDVVARALPAVGRSAAARGAGLLSAAVCAAAAWGFFDYLAIDAFRARADGTPHEKVAAVAEGVGRDAFLLRRQLALDVRAAGRVLSGERWDTVLTAEEWNEWLDAADWSWLPDAASLKEAAGSRRVPLVVTGGDAPRGLLVKPLALVVPFGLLVLTLRFLLWVLRGAHVTGAHLEVPGAQVAVS